MQKKSRTNNIVYSKIHEDRTPINAFNKKDKVDSHQSGRMRIGGTTRKYPKKVSSITAFCLLRGSKDGVDTLSENISNIFSSSNMLKTWCGFRFNFENFSDTIKISGKRIDLGQYDSAILYYHFNPVSLNTRRDTYDRTIEYAMARLRPERVLSEYVERYMRYSDDIRDDLLPSSSAYNMLEDVRWDTVDSFQNLNDRIKDFVNSITRIHPRRDIKDKGEISNFMKLLNQIRNESANDIKNIKPLLYLNISRKLKNVRPSVGDIQIPTKYKKEERNHTSVDIDQAFMSGHGSKSVQTRPDAQWRLVLINSKKLGGGKIKIIDIITGNIRNSFRDAYLSIPAKEAFWYGYGIDIVKFLGQSNVQEYITRMADNFKISISSYLNALYNDYKEGNINGYFDKSNDYLRQCIKSFADIVGNPAAMDALLNSMLDPKNTSSSSHGSNSINYGRGVMMHVPYNND